MQLLHDIWAGFASRRSRRGARTTRRGNLARTSDKARRARIIDAARRAARAHGTRNGTRHDARARTTRRGPASAPCSKNQSIRLLGGPHNSLFPSSTKGTARPAPAVPYSLGGVTIEKPPVDKAHCALYMGQPEYPTSLRVDLTRKTRKKRLKQTQSGPAEKNSTEQPIPVQYETHRATGSGRAIQLGWGHNRKTTGGQSPLRAVYGPTRIPHPPPGRFDA